MKRPVIDVLRIISILAVVLIHASTRTLEASGFALQKIPFTLFLNQISRFAVPLFFMISGFGLQLNHNPSEGYWVYLKKRLNRIFVPFVFWSAIYYFLVYSQNRNPSFFSSILLGDASYQLYFIPSLLIFYLVFPLIHKYLNDINKIGTLIIMLLFQILFLFYDYNIHEFTFYYPLRIVLFNYFLFILGSVLAKNYTQFTNFISKWWPILLLGTIASGFYVFYEGLSKYLVSNNYLAFYSQWRPSVLLYTIFLGGLLYWLFNNKLFDSKLVKTLSKLSFFVFFTHVIVLEVLWYTIGSKIFQLSFAQHFWWDPVYFLAVTTMSFTIAYFIHKIPYLSKLTG